MSSSQSAPADFCAAVAATPAQPEVRENGEVVVCRDGAAAGRTNRAKRPQQRGLGGRLGWAVRRKADPVDGLIEEAAPEPSAEQDGRRPTREERAGHERPVASPNFSRALRLAFIMKEISAPMETSW